MTAPIRRPARIAVFGGCFASQQLAFAHVLDVADRAAVALDIDAVDVMQGERLGPRLAHYFDRAVAGRILDALQTDDTCILLTRPGALPPADTRHMRWLGVFDGYLVRARPESPC